MLEEKLEICLITYNRCLNLAKTLNKVFASDSPVRNVQITIFDNNSNDGTEKLCKEFTLKYPNLTYVRNKRNVGLAGNICKAMEFVSKEYFWILCDNDELDFSGWDEIEKAINENNDLIIVNQIFKPIPISSEIEEFACKLASCMFLPAAIFKTSHITDFLMSYMMNEIPTCFPHMALVYEIANNNGKFACTNQKIVQIKANDDYSETHDRICENRKHYSFKNGYIEASLNYLNTLKIIKDKNLKQALVNISIAGRGFGYIDFKRLAAFYADKKITTVDVLIILKELQLKDKRKFLRKILKKVFFNFNKKGRFHNEPIRTA